MKKKTRRKLGDLPSVPFGNDNLKVRLRFELNAKKLLGASAYPGVQYLDSLSLLIDVSTISASGKIFKVSKRIQEKYTMLHF